MSVKDTVINAAIADYFKRMKGISLDAMTDHLDRSQDKEIEAMLRKILSDVYDAGWNG